MKQWTQERLIAVAQAFDRRAQGEERERYSEYRYVAYSARSFARQKDA